MDDLRQFMGMSSGHVLPRRTLSVSYFVVAFALVGLVGGFQPVAADDCGGVPMGHYGWACYTDQPLCPNGQSGQEDQCNSEYIYHSCVHGCMPLGPAGCCDC